MVTVETIGRIRRAFLVDHKPIRQIVRELRVSRKTVRKAIRGSSTEFRYDRQAQPQPRLGEFVARLDGLLEANSKRPARERLTARRLFELLRAEGYQGACDSVQRHARAWRRARSQQGAVFIPLWFAPGEAYQFDWSHEVVMLGGVTCTRRKSVGSRRTVPSRAVETTEPVLSVRRRHREREIERFRIFRRSSRAGAGGHAADVVEMRPGLGAKTTSSSTPKTPDRRRPGPTNAIQRRARRRSRLPIHVALAAFVARG